MRQYLMSKYGLSNKGVDRIEMLMRGVSYKQITESQNVTLSGAKGWMKQMKARFKVSNSNELMVVLTKIQLEQNHLLEVNALKYKIGQLENTIAGLNGNINSLKIKINSDMLPIGAKYG